MKRHSWLVMLWLIASGCPKSALSPDDEAMAAALADADAAWASRGRTGLDRVMTTLDGVPVSRQNHPEVLWRRTRVEVARGWSADTVLEARRAFARGRAWGMRCVEGPPVVMRMAQEGRLVDGIPLLPGDRKRCAAWTGVAWTRWLITWERTASTVDGPVVSRLLDVGAGPADRDVLAWSKALLLLRLPDHLGGDAEAGRTALLAAGKGTDIARWVWWEDVSQWVHPIPTRRAPTATPRTPEDRAAKARLDGGAK